MPRMIRAWVTSPAFVSSVSTVLPSRMTVTRSEIAVISLSLCEIMIEVMPRSWRRRSRPSRCSESLSFSAAVGSSRISSFTSLDSAFAISTSCCLPTPSWPTGVTGFSSRPTEASSFAASAFARFQSMRPLRPRRSLPRKMFSAMDRYGTSASSWWMITIPTCSLSRMPPKEADCSVVEDLAVVAARRVDAREHLHQRRLAGAVLTADRVDLAPADVEVARSPAP